MTESRTDAASPDRNPLELRVDLMFEPFARLVIIRAHPRAPKRGDARPRDAGPFGSSRARTGFGPERAELLRELRVLVAIRTLRSCRVQLGRIVGSWGPFSLGVLPSDFRIVRDALVALFESGDEGPLRAFMAWPPPLVDPAEQPPPWEVLRP
jgi:hypothetical protein